MLNELQQAQKRILAAIEHKRGEKEQFLYLFQKDETFIFEYKAIKKMGLGMMKVLVWGMLKEGSFQELTFRGMGDEERQFEEGRLLWGDKQARWEGKQEQLMLKVLFRHK